MSKKLSQEYVMLRRHNPAWLLLASTKAPLTASCLKTILEAKPVGVPWDDAVEILAEVFAEHANDEEFGLEITDDQSPAARKEMRRWLKNGLVVERDGMLLATDALERSLAFLSDLEDRTMTSTASRLATVQREIENLEASLNPNQESRVASLHEKIHTLEKELVAAKKGDFQVLQGPAAQEGVREIYQLALSLRSDFRRVEDSYREADRALRQRILSEGSNRGEIVDSLLDSHDALVQTAEGQVFENFHEQLLNPLELDRMKLRLRAILDNEATSKSLTRQQQTELRSLVNTLVSESQGVINARSRSERDVRSFIKSGLADEQVKVGTLLQQILAAALEVDWTSQKIRRADAPIPPVAMAQPNLRLLQRLAFRDKSTDDAPDLDLAETPSSPEHLGADFWQAYQALDRAELFEQTLALLKKSGRPHTLAELAKALPPTHDLETLTYWLSMAREAGITLDERSETFPLADEETSFEFTVPLASLDSTTTQHVDPETLG